MVVAAAASPLPFLWILSHRLSLSPKVLGVTLTLTPLTFGANFAGGLLRGFNEPLLKFVLLGIAPADVQVRDWWEAIR
jgi:hypothetical protein